MEQETHVFWQKVEKTKLELGVDKVYNADQSGICFEYLPKQTVNKKGQKTIWVRCGGKDKERFTAMYLGDPTGKRYDSFYVMKTDPSKIHEKAAYNYVAQHGFGDTLWRTTKAAQTANGVQIYDNSSAWWNSDLSVSFLDYHFASRNEATPVLLLWDDFSAHWTDEVLQHAELLNVHLMKVPPGLTSVCQPADISWFCPLKQRLRMCWVQHLSQQLRVYNAGDKKSKFQLCPPTRTDAISWATTAWKELGEQVIISGFTHANKQHCAEEHENAIVERLEQLQVGDETVCDSDDIVDNFIGETAGEQ